MYLDINLDQCVLPAHIKQRLQKIVTPSQKIPSMIFYGWCRDEIETVALSIAHRAELLPIKVTPRLVPKLRRHTQSESFVRRLEELLNTVTVDTLQKRLIIIDDLSGLAKKDHASLTKVVENATKGSVAFISYHETDMPKPLRQSVPMVGFSFNMNHRADTKHDISQQCMQLLSSLDMSVNESDIQSEIESVYPHWTKLADKMLLKEFPTTDLKLIRRRFRRPMLIMNKNISCEYLAHSFDRYNDSN